MCARRNACGAKVAKMGAGNESGGGAGEEVVCCDPAGAGRFVPAVAIVVGYVQMRFAVGGFCFVGIVEMWLAMFWWGWEIWSFIWNQGANI